MGKGGVVGPSEALTAEQWALVQRNRGLVFKVINTHYPSLRDDDDAIQNGMMGLARAVQKWDPSVARLSTFAFFWIWQCVGGGIDIERGASYRALKANGQKDEWQPPLSVDALHNVGSQPLGDAVSFLDFLEAGDSDFVTPSLERLVVMDMFDRLIADHCQDHVDVDIAENERDGALGHPSLSLVELAEIHMVSREAIRRRRSRLLGCLAEMLDRRQE